MEVRGKLLAGIVGMVVFDLSGLPLGGLWGFFIGSMLGHVLFDRRRELASSEEEFRAYRRRQGTFLYHVFSLCAKMAKSDGPINRQEVELMERLMRQHFRLPDRGRQEVIRIWNAAKNSNTGFDQYARAFYQEFGRERHQVLNMMDLLFATAAADGGLDRREEVLLLRAAGLFHIGRLQYDRIKYRYYQRPNNQQSGHRQQAGQQFWSPLDPYYAILGAQPEDSLDLIKKKFRQLAMQWHPDKVSARGVSNDALRHAQEKFRQINEAYEKIVEARKK